MLCFRFISRKLFNASAYTELNTLYPRKPINDVQVVVIGAGLAGLSAASHLIKNGFKHTILLEATDRYGGRVNSKQFGDAFCELGAKWISIDASKDSMYELLRQATGLQKKIRQRDEMLLYVDTSGHKVNQKMTELVDVLFRRVCSGIELEEKYKSGDLHDLNNVHTYFQAETSKIIKAVFKAEEQATANDIFTALCKEFGSLLGCCLEYVNIEHITNTKMTHHTNQTNPIYIPTGLDNVLNQIASNIDNHHMKVGTPVGEINWYGGASKLDPKSVGCMDGSVFSADHIICTLPLGVLKNFSGYMFKPMLPNGKLNAIRNIGFGSPVKVYFEYEEDIKPWFDSNIRPLWSARERKRDLIWMKQVVEIAKLPTSTRVLEILIGGAYYDLIEKLPDIEVVNEITKILRSCLKNSKIPYPTSVLRSNWSSSACYLGGRPYFATGSSTRDVTTLAEPLPVGDIPTLLFAGDATILNGFGTLDGARMSGIREAQRIIDYYSRLS